MEGTQSQQPKRRRLLARVSSVGSEPDEDWRAQHLAPGVRKADELCEWPLDVVQSLCREDIDEEIKCRMRTHLLDGISLFTDYSGIDAPREALRLGFLGFQHVLDMSSLPDPVWVGRTCDKGMIQKRVLIALSELEGGSQCHFDDVMHRLAPAGQQWISAAKPPKQMLKDDRLQAYGAINNWVQENRDVIFALDRTCSCSVHRRPA